MIVLIDLDSTCNDLWSYIFEKYKEKTGIEYNKSILVSWDFRKFFPKEMVSWLSKTIKEPGFFYNLQPKLGCIETVKYLNDNSDVYIVTALANSFWSSDTYYTDKIRWIKRYLPFIKERNIIFCSSKFIVSGDVLIDDSPTQVRDFKNTTILVDYPYNRSVKSDFRARTWDEIKGYCEYLIERDI